MYGIDDKLNHEICPLIRKGGRGADCSSATNMNVTEAGGLLKL